MLNIDIGIDLASKQLSADVVRLQRTIRELISALEPTKLEAPFGRPSDKRLAGDVAIDRHAPQQWLVTCSVVTDLA